MRHPNLEQGRQDSPFIRAPLYKRGFSTPILKWVGREDANYVLREVHEGVCNNHIGARTLTGKSLEAGVLLAHNA